MAHLREGVLLLLAALFAGGCSKEEAEAPKVVPLALHSAAGVPKNVMGYLLVGNAARTIDDLEKLAGRVGSVPPGMLQSMIIGGAFTLGLKDTGVIDLKGPAGILLLDPKRHPSPVVGACSTTGKDKVLESMKPVWRSKEEKDGLLEMVCEKPDRCRVLSKATDATRKSPSLFLHFEGPMMYAATDAGGMKAGLSLLKKTMRAGVPDRGAVGMLMVSHLRRTYGPELAAAGEKIKQRIPRDASKFTVDDPKAFSRIVGLGVDKVVSLVKQTRDLAFTVDFQEDGAVLRAALTAEKGSFFARLLGAQEHTGKPLRLLDALPDDHFLAMSLNVQWQTVKEDLLAFTSELMKVFLGSAISREYLDAMLQMWEVMGDEVAFCENISAEGLSVVQVAEVKDTTRAWEVFTRLMKLSADLLARSDRSVMGMKLRYEGPMLLGEHQGIKMQAIDMTWDLSDMPSRRAQLVKRFYGDRLRMVVACFEEKMALTMGKNAEEEMKALIERTRGRGRGLGSAEAFRSAAGGLQKDAGGVLFISISRLIGDAISNAFAAMGKQAPQIKIPSPESGLFIGFKSTPRRLTSTLRLPARHLAELGETIKAISRASKDRPR